MTRALLFVEAGGSAPLHPPNNFYWAGARGMLPPSHHTLAYRIVPGMPAMQVGSCQNPPARCTLPLATKRYSSTR